VARDIVATNTSPSNSDSTIQSVVVGFLD